MKKYISDYTLTNKEKFNYQLLKSKSDNRILEEVTTIFKSLEQIPAIHVEDIRLDTHEEEFGPIRDGKNYYKPLHGTRLQRIHFRIRVDGLENNIEKDLYLLKLIDNNYYINDGTRYFPIWQIVPDLCIHSNNAVMFKPLAMPVSCVNTVTRDYTAEFSGECFTEVKSFETLAFSKSIPMLIYYMSKFSTILYNKFNIDSMEDVENTKKDIHPELITMFNEYFHIDAKFNNDSHELIEDGRLVFKQPNGLSFSLPKDSLDTINGKIVLSMLLGSRNLKDKKLKKEALGFTVEEFSTPFYWINMLGSAFTRGTDAYKRYKKGTSIIRSVDRLVDQTSVDTLPVDLESKKDWYALNYWTCRNFNKLMKRDNMDLENMKLNLFEYILYPLRVKFTTKINQLLNQANITPDDIYKLFKNLSPMFLIKELVNSGLIHMYENTNEFGIFNMTLKATFVGPAGGATRNLTLNQRDIHPSFMGRVDLVAASPGNPGPTTVLLPFSALENNKFSNKIVTDDEPLE